MPGWSVICGVLLGFVAFYFAWISVLVEPRRLVVERYLLNPKRMPLPLDGLTIAFLSDFHIMPSGFGVDIAERAVLLANEANPDIVLLGGDLVHWCSAIPHLIPVLRRIKSRHGVFAVLGNHDHHCPWRFKRPAPWGGKPFSIDEWRKALEQANVCLLVNEAIELNINGASLWLVGVDDPTFSLFSDTAVELMLKGTFPLQIVIEDEEGKPCRATVTVSSESDRMATVNGSTIQVALPKGRYIIEATAPGYSSIRSEISVPNSTEVKLVLTKVEKPRTWPMDPAYIVILVFVACLVVTQLLLIRNRKKLMHSSSRR